MRVAKRDLRPRTREAILGLALASALAAAFVALAVALAWKQPLCCVDDALFAVVAKNVAEGRGYVATVEPFAERPFDARIATGPTSILPASAAIALFGADARVPGLAHVALWIALTGLALRAATRLGARGSVLLAAFAASQLAASAWYFEQWHALLGEVPAALLVVIGTSLLARDDGTRRHAFASGLAFGAATLGKLLAALYLVAPLLWIACALRRRRAHDPAARAGWAFAFTAGLLATHGAFEAWKLTELGLAGWSENARIFGAFFAANAVGDAQSAGWAELARRAALLGDRFALSPLLFAATIALAALAFRDLSGAARRFVALLLAGAGVHLLYWLLLSDGRPRYAHAATVVFGFALAFLLASVRTPAPLRVGLAALLGWMLVAGLPNLERPWRRLGADARRPETSQPAAAAAMAHAIGLRTAGARIGTPSWGHVATLEYLASEPGRFRIAPGEGARLGWLLVDERLAPREGESLAVLLADCPRIAARHGFYTLRRCLSDDSTGE